MSTSKYPNEIKINPNQGGKAAIERLVEAYGFTTRQALADHLEVSKSTLANRYMRDTFPADWIIQCAIETGISLNWLTTGKGPKQIFQKHVLKRSQSSALLQEKWLKMAHTFLTRHSFHTVSHLRLLFLMAQTPIFASRHLLMCWMVTG